MHFLMSHIRFGALIAAMLCMMASRSMAQELAAEADFEVREWVILLADPNQSRVNSAMTGRITLPDFMTSMREKAPFDPNNPPAPVGILRMRGATDQKINVKLSGPSVLFNSFWPAAATRTTELSWRDIILSSQPGLVEPLDPRHWLAPLRNGNYSHMQVGGRSERFLLYDVGFLYITPLKLTGGSKPGEAMQISNIGASPLHNMVFYRREGDSWQTGELAQVPPDTGSNPTTLPVELKTLAVSSTQPADVCGDWRKRLADFDLDPTDLDLIVRTLAAYALDDRQTTVVYRLDSSEIDRLLRLEISPTPQRVKRLALVVVRNIDPALSVLIDAMIAQLGDNDWRKREAASQMLSQIGKVAESKLRAALQSRDPEVVLRAERLLAPTRPAPAPQPVPAGTLIVR